jgi:hypothetical protein
LESDVALPVSVLADRALALALLKRPGHRIAGLVVGEARVNHPRVADVDDPRLNFTIAKVARHFVRELDRSALDPFGLAGFFALGREAVIPFVAGGGRQHPELLQDGAFVARHGDLLRADDPPAGGQELGGRNGRRRRRPARRLGEGVKQRAAVRG